MFLSRCENRLQMTKTTFYWFYSWSGMDLILLACIVFWPHSKPNIIKVYQIKWNIGFYKRNHCSNQLIVFKLKLLLLKCEYKNILRFVWEDFEQFFAIELVVVNCMLYVFQMKRLVYINILIFSTGFTINYKWMIPV